jgi:hypothetical protein
MTEGCPEAAEEGNAVGMRDQTHAPDAGTRIRRMRSGRVLRSVLWHVHVDPHYAPSAQAAEVGRATGASRLGKLAQARGTSTGAFVTGRSASRRVSPLPQGRQRGPSKKRKEIEVSVPARSEELGFGCPHVEVTQLQKSVGDGWPRISSANALQKERSGSSERGPSSERGSAGDTVGSHFERRARRESARPVVTVVGPAQDPG